MKLAVFAIGLLVLLGVLGTTSATKKKAKGAGGRPSGGSELVCSGIPNRGCHMPISCETCIRCVVHLVETCEDCYSADEQPEPVLQEAPRDSRVAANSRSPYAESAASPQARFGRAVLPGHSFRARLSLPPPMVYVYALNTDAARLPVLRPMLQERQPPPTPPLEVRADKSGLASGQHNAYYSSTGQDLGKYPEM
jgi:hypothetical protein